MQQVRSVKIYQEEFEVCFDDKKVKATWHMITPAGSSVKTPNKY